MGSLFDVVFLVSDEDVLIIDKLLSVFEVFDILSESFDDIFMCSEFEYDNDEFSWDENEWGSMIFFKLVNGDVKENESILRRKLNEGWVLNWGLLSILNLSDDEILLNVLNNKLMNGKKDLFNWDDVLNWGLRYYNFWGVYKDIV